MSDYHMTPADLDETDLEFLLDLEVLDSKIEAASSKQLSKRDKWSKGKAPPFSGPRKTIDQIMNF